MSLRWEIIDLRAGDKTFSTTRMSANSTWEVKTMACSFLNIAEGGRKKDLTFKKELLDNST
jgi:hypothetical protein